MNVSFRGTEDPPGLAISDPIEQRHLHVATHAPVSPEPADDDVFLFPVEAACRVRTGGFRIDRYDDVYVRGDDGTLLSSLRSHQTADFEAGTYCIEVSGPIKLYCRVTGVPTLASGADYVTVSFSEETEVVFGARSYHDHPATTITTTEDPRDVMTAVSALSSALKTTSCERAYPTLRGHPPLIELGEALHVPDGLSVPDTGITVEVPPTHRHTFAVTSLSFYLGADVVPGETPRIVTDRGFEHHLGDDRWFEDDVARTLKQVFLLDCVVRTEGLYRVDLYERRLVERALDVDLATVYDMPLQEQVATYLEVPYEAVADAVPTWCLTAHVDPMPENVAALPFVANDLGVVREPRGALLRSSDDVVDAPARPSATDGGAAGTSAGAERGAGEGEGLTLVDPAHTDESVEHAWFGDHVPRGASKATLEGFRARLEQRERTGVIDITVVCNDEEMLAEQEDIDAVYGSRSDLPFEVTTHFDLSTGDLSAVLAETDCDFLHYIGHATPEGLECPDGYLDVGTLPTVGPRVFLLNACRSYEQALALTEGGAIGGVGTVGDVVDEHAVEIGKTMANLLNQGFPLRGAMELVREHTRIGDQYLIVGDGAADIAQTDGGPPQVSEVERVGEDEFRLRLRVYPTRVLRMGTTVTPTLDGVTQRFLLPGRTGPITLSQAELEDYLTWSVYPVRIDGDLRWNDALEPIDLD